MPAREVLLEQTERRRRAASLAAQRLRLAEGDLGHRDEAPGGAELARGEAVAAGLERRLAGAEAALGRRRVGLAVAGRALLELRQPVLGVGPPRGVARREVLLVERDRLLVVTAELMQGLRAVEDQLGELEQALGSREGIVGLRVFVATVGGLALTEDLLGRRSVRRAFSVQAALPGDRCRGGYGSRRSSREQRRLLSD